MNQHNIEIMLTRQTAGKDHVRVRELPSLPLHGADPRLEEVAAAWVYTHASENTRLAYWADLVAFAAFCTTRGAGVLDARSADIEAFRAEVEGSGASAATVARRLAALSSFYRYAGQPGSASPGNPVTSVARPAVPASSATDVLSGDEVRTLLRAARSLGPKTAGLICLLVLDGLKLGETVAADAGHLAFRGGVLLLIVPHRDADQPELRLHRDTARALAAYLDGRRDGPLLLAETGTGGPRRRLTRFGANYLVKRAVETARLAPSVSANTLRRTYAATALDGGSNVRLVQRRLGHADRRTTERLRTERTGH
jgi:site-specific recombinase XerD